MPSSATQTLDGGILAVQSSGPRCRKLLWTLVALLGLAVCALVSIAVGSRPLSPVEVAGALLSPSGTEADVVVRALRVPRTLLGIAVGVALGLAGALAQGLTRNPIAEPGLLGLSAGAAFSVVMAIQLLGVGTALGYVWFAFAGAAVAAVVVHVVGASGPAGGTPVTLALAGAALTALLVALTQAVVVLDAETLDAYRFWVVGSIAGRGLDVLVPMLPFLVVGAVLALASAGALNLLGLGEDVARGLGLSVGRARLLGVVAMTLLVGGAVACAGPISFVGLVVPHVARAVTGPDHRWLLPLSGLLGGCLLLIADVVGRLVARPGELQVGIVLAVVGAPFFVALVRRRLVRL